MFNYKEIYRKQKLSTFDIVMITTDLDDKSLSESEIWSEFIENFCKKEKKSTIDKLNLNKIKFNLFKSFHENLIILLK